MTALVGRTLHRWDLATGKELYPDLSKRGHNGTVDAVAWSGDGRLIATRNQLYDPCLRVWDAADGKLLATLPAPIGQEFGACWLAFSPDGKRLFSAGGDGAVHCWDVAEEKQLWTNHAANEQPRSLDKFQVSGDGMRVTTLSLERNGSWGGGQETTRDASTGKAAWQSAVPMASQADAYSSDGLWRLTWTGELFDVRVRFVGQTLKARFKSAILSETASARFSPDGHLFAAPLQETVVNAKSVE